MDKKTKTILPVSIVIPTYCEEDSLPKLLQSIENQLFAPYEVIVADAQSTDKTREIAKKFGCVVVEGGKPAVGRNKGAKAANGDFILFLDSDTELPHPLVLGDSFIQFIKEDVDIASARFIVSKDESSEFGKNAGAIVWGISNLVRSVQSLISYPRWEGGAFILVKKSVFEHIGGFDVKAVNREDIMFFHKASSLGYKYRHLPVDVITSVRRYDTPEKLIKMVGWVAFESALLSLGMYAGNRAAKNFSKWYGRLGGGEGKDPGEE